MLLGFGNNGAFDYRRARSVWQVNGQVAFDGPARLGHGFKLSCAGRVRFGAGFVLQAESQIVCREEITFGSDCLLSWDVLVLDSDFHEITVSGAAPSAVQVPVRIGERVWIGARSTVLKGVSIADGTIVAAGSLVVSSSDERDVLLGGHPAVKLRSGVGWRR